MDKVLVMLSSYNGEKYIEEQIDSILAQSGVEVHLIVRDDGSKDKTPSILERYQKEGALEWYTGENLGWKSSFMHMAVHSPEYEYYAFSDQDDHWLPNKLIIALETLKKMPQGPSLYMSNVIYWENGVDKGLSLPEKVRTDVFHSLLFSESFGCTMLFNSKLMDIVKNHPPKLAVAHDFWFAQVASIFGNIFYDNSSYILYRQHSNNQLGFDKFFIEKNKRRIKSYLNLWNFHELDIQAQELLNCFSSIMSDEQKNIVSVVANYRKDWRKYFQLLFSSKYSHERFLTNLGLKYRVLIRHI